MQKRSIIEVVTSKLDSIIYCPLFIYTRITYSHIITKYLTCISVRIYKIISILALVHRIVLFFCRVVCLHYRQDSLQYL